MTGEKFHLKFIVFRMEHKSGYENKIEEGTCYCRVENNLGKMQPCSYSQPKKRLFLEYTTKLSKNFFKLKNEKKISLQKSC